MNSPHEQFSFVQAEHQVLKFWKEHDTFQKSLHKTQNQPTYTFYDGPPFATGLPHHGHLLASTIKDIIARYRTMEGHYVERRFGWDCHGLPIENEIDKKLGMGAHEAIQKIGMARYNDHCRNIVQKYTSKWNKTITRIGRWVDFVNDYKTMDKNFMESVWWALKKLWDKNYIYYGTKVVPYCPKMQTVLSNFEAGLDYRQVQDPAITVLFKLRDEEAYLAAWTTTPWTLPANLGLCVKADTAYTKVRDEDKKIDFYLAREALIRYQKNRRLKILSHCTGAQLKGKKYHPLFDYFVHQEKQGAFCILNDDYVTTETGTGIVHTAPNFGEDDNRVMKEAGLSSCTASPIDKSGHFTHEAVHFSGEYIKDADKKIISQLKKTGHLYEHSTYVHSYPYCYRSGAPLIYRTVPCWYVRVEKMREQLEKSNAQINWIPPHIKTGRFGNWLENARDWAIGRNRIWGTPIPIWINDETGTMDCFGSIEEFKKITGVELQDMHREFVDPITYQKPKEPGTYRRTPEILDCWFESGSMPYGQSHYPFENKEQFERQFPADFITEGLDQTRGWFYTLTILSTALFQKPAFKNVIVSGMVLAKDGKKMSKSLRNYTPPDDLMETYGADALRLALISSPLVKAEEQRFSDEALKDMTRRVLLPWYNSFKFFTTYAQLDNWNPKSHLEKGEEISDQWILSKLQTLTEQVSKSMNTYHLDRATPHLFHFIDHLNNWYIRLNRRRFWAEKNSPNKNQAYTALYLTLKQITTLMAPIAPFLSEWIFQELRKRDPELPESVHLCPYPKANPRQKNPELEDAMSRMQQIVLLGRQKRNQFKIKVKTPLQTLTVLHRDPKILRELEKLELAIKTELNVKEVVYAENEEDYIDLYARPNFPVLGKKLGKDFKHYQKLISSLTDHQCRKIEEGCGVTLEGREFSSEEILIFREAKKGTHALSNRLISINLDGDLTDDLIQEGIAREVVSRIQKTRKDMQLHISQRIIVDFSGSPEIISSILKHQNHISQEILANEMRVQDELKTPHLFQIDGNQFKIILHPQKLQEEPPEPQKG